MREAEQEKGCVALIAPSNAGEREVAGLVRARLAQLGYRWSAVEIELWSGGEESLVIARPAAEERIYISAFALKYLMS